MTRRRLPLLLAAVGLLIILVATIAAVVVRSSDTATLALDARPDVPVVITEPGVLDAVGSDVTVRATAGDDEQVVLAVGRTSEVEAWLGDADHARVTGLTSWESLTVEVVTGTAPTDAPTDAATEAPTDGATDDAENPAASGLPDPAGSDLWLAESVGTGSAELSWTDSPGRWSLVAATDGTGPAPELELEWGRQVSTPWLVPGIILGALALVAGATMLVLDVLARREQRRRDDARARREAAGEDEPQLSITDTDPGTGERLTRRQIREMERRMAEADRRRRAGEPVAPPIPLAPAWVEDDDEPADRSPDGAPPEDADTAEADAADRAAQPVLPPAGDRDGGTTDDGDADGPDDHSEPDGTPPPTGASSSADEAEEADAADEPPAPPSWRSVWGFGGAAVAGPATTGPTPTDDTDTTDHHDDGEEQR
ncbi:MAG TPA: hypothetical protein VKZ83_12750 [Phototrophicaceae bacterium]|nr:hypothetical protein [Phototrophicaceae bacterium]